MTSLHNLLVFSWQKRPIDWSTDIASYTASMSILVFAYTVSGSNLETFISVYLLVQPMCCIFMLVYLYFSSILYTSKSSSVQPHYDYTIIHLMKFTIISGLHLLTLTDDISAHWGGFQSCHVLPF